MHVEAQFHWPHVKPHTCATVAAAAAPAANLTPQLCTIKCSHISPAHCSWCLYLAFLNMSNRPSGDGSLLQVSHFDIWIMSKCVCSSELVKFNNFIGQPELSWYIIVDREHSLFYSSIYKKWFCRKSYVLPQINSQNESVFICLFIRNKVFT